MRTHLIITLCTTFVFACIIHDGPGSKAPPKGAKKRIKKRFEKGNNTNQTKPENKKLSTKKEKGFINSGYSGWNILFATHKYKTSFIVYMRIETMQYITGCQHRTRYTVQHTWQLIKKSADNSPHEMDAYTVAAAVYINM